MPLRRFQGRFGPEAMHTLVFVRKVSFGHGAKLGRLPVENA